MVFLFKVDYEHTRAVVVQELDVRAAIDCYGVILVNDPAVLDDDIGGGNVKAIGVVGQWLSAR